MKNNFNTHDEIEVCQGVENTRPSGFCAENATPAKPLSLKKELSGLLCLLLALALFCAVAIPVFTPKRHDYGAVWGMYLAEPENTVDTLFLGSSLAYCDIVPSIIYEESGISSFLMTGPFQTFPVTYRYLLEACKTQSPTFVFIEATGLIYDKQNRYTKVNLTYMPWSQNRLIPTMEEALTEGGKTPEETAKLEQNARIGLLWPMFAYHDRWDELTLRDFKEGLLGYDTDPLAGYTFLDHIEKIEKITEREFNEDFENYERNLSYAKKIVDFCNENGITPVFFISPTTQRLSDDWTNRIETDLTGLGAQFLDFNDNFNELELDLSVDFYDKLHLNCHGAKKFSNYLAQLLPQYVVSPAGKADEALWQKRAEHFYKLCEEEG